jgi:hypothetical protein
VAEACSCYENPPCSAVWRADAVFVGTVVERVQEPVGGTISWTVHNVAVTQRLHGSVDSSITLVGAAQPTAEQIEASKSAASPAGIMSTCDYNFEVGRRYVIYARKTAEGRWTTSMCAGTKPIEQAAADLDYIARIPAAAPTGRVFGSIERMIANSPDPAGQRVMPAAGVSVELTSSATRLMVTTDADGKLDVQVPPGDYTIAPVVPETIRVYGAPFQTAVHARGCAPVQFGIVSNGRIEGRVVQLDGSPVVRASVDILPADLPPGQRPDSYTTSPSSDTDENGNFVVDAILPGRYVVAVNARRGPRLDSPFATTYLPGVNRANAEVVEIGDGERKTGFTLVVSPAVETTVSGIVVLDGDRPAAEADVSAALVDHRGTSMSFTKTDSSGAFQLRVLAGMTYVIRAGVRTADAYRRAEEIAFVEQPQEGLVLSVRR